MSEQKSEKNSDTLSEWAKWSAAIAEDISAGILTFIPHGLSAMYDVLLKPLPFVGRFFASVRNEKTIKWMTGITLSKNLGLDISRCLFWPIGFCLGLLPGLFLSKQKAPVYQNSISRCLLALSLPVVGGALVGAMLLWVAIPLSSSIWAIPSHLESFFIAASVGAFIGILLKISFVFITRTVNGASTEVIRQNGLQAKALNAKLKTIARQRTKHRILTQAKDIIQQMNGPQSPENIEAFFKNAYEHIAVSVYEKIERHFNYLADRACCGDVKALARMKALIPKEEEPSPALDSLLERLFNPRTLAKLKDDMDTYYDKWLYRALAVKS